MVARPETIPAFFLFLIHYTGHVRILQYRGPSQSCYLDFNKPDSISESTHKTAAIRYITDEEAETNLKIIKSRYPEILVEVNEQGGRSSEIFDSSTRKGYYIIASYDRECIISLMPECR